MRCLVAQGSRRSRTLNLPGKDWMRPRIQSQDVDPLNSREELEHASKYERTMGIELANASLEVLRFRWPIRVR
jgi:hypothetical protein